MSGKADRIRQSWLNPEVRERRCAGLSAAAKRRYQDPEQRRLAAERTRQQMANRSPEEKEAERARLKAIQYISPKTALGISQSSPEYKVWIAMNQRCSNPKVKQYADYGGRGIRVTPEWSGPGGFVTWFEHVGPRPSPQHSIGRIDNAGNYEPGNVRWEDRHQQMANFRRNRNVTIGGVTLHLEEWARRAGLTAPALAGRIERGWPEERLLSPPLPCGRRARNATPAAP